MAKIIVKKRAEVIQEYFIGPFKSIVTVGTDSDNDLVIEDKRVSLYHFNIEKKGGELGGISGLDFLDFGFIP